MYSSSQGQQPVAPAPVQSLRPHEALPIGRECIFLSMVPFILFTAVQYQNYRTGLIAAMAVAGAMLLLGLLLFHLQVRHARVYILDACMLVVSAVALGVSFPYPEAVSDYLNFITNGGLVVLGLLSMVCTYPFTLQHIRESVPRPAWRSVSVRTRSFLTTTLFVGVFTANSLLYLIPVAKGRLQSPSDPLNYVFRIILPTVFVVAAAITTRFASGNLGDQTHHSEGFDGGLSDLQVQVHMAPGLTKVLVNPLAWP